MKSTIVFLILRFGPIFAKPQALDLASILSFQDVRARWSTPLLQKRSGDVMSISLEPRGQKEKKRQQTRQQTQQQTRQQNVLKRGRQFTAKDTDSTNQMSPTQQLVPQGQSSPASQRKLSINVASSSKPRSPELTDPASPGQPSSPEAQLSKLSLSSGPEKQVEEVASNPKGPFSPRTRKSETIHANDVNTAVRTLATFGNEVKRTPQTPWLEQTKAQIKILNERAGHRPDQLPARMAAKGSNYARSERRFELLAQTSSKAAWAHANTAYQTAYRTFSNHDAGSMQSNVAYAVANAAGADASLASWQYVDAVGDSSRALARSGKGIKTAASLGSMHRARTRAAMRDAHNDAFRYGYLASASKNIAKDIDPSNVQERTEAVQRAVAMKRRHTIAVHNYRQGYKDWQAARNEFPGGSSDESEKEFADIPRE